MKGASWVSLCWQLISRMYRLHKAAYWKHVSPNRSACHFQGIWLSPVSQSGLISPVLLVPEHHDKSNFHLRQRNNGSSLRWVSPLSDVHSSHVTKNSFSNGCAHTQVWCTARTHAPTLDTIHTASHSGTIILTHMHTNTCTQEINELSH